VKGLAVFGIDLTSTENKPTACFGLDDKLQVIYLGFAHKNSDIIAILKFHSPQVIAIDAPITLPLGLYSPEQNPSCQATSPLKGRACERELAMLGIPCYFTTEKSIIKEMVYRGIELKNKLCQMGLQVIEVYPYASKVRLFGKTLPRKTTPQGIAFLKARLAEIVPSLKPHLSIFNHDLCDAAIAAYTAFLYCRNMVAALGIEEEGLIFIPLEQLSHH
jgi:predicted nuclease with RNAse H fold